MAKRIQTRFIARTIEGAVPSSAMPGFNPPQLATLKPRAPSGERWIHEIKYDDYRLQIHLNKGRITMFTRNGHNWTNRFSRIANSFAITVEKAIFDGELCVVHQGRTNFSELQADLAAGKQECLVFYTFDLLFLDGFDLRKSPQIERKRSTKLQRAHRNRRQRDVRRGSFRSSDLRKIRAASLRSISANGKARISSIWARSGPAGHGQSQAKSENNSTPS
jgi:ATP-dependent DNA ligase